MSITRREVLAGPLVARAARMPTSGGFSRGWRNTAPRDPKRVGRSYAGFLRGQAPRDWRNRLYFEYARALRTENWRSSSSGPALRRSSSGAQPRARN
jgi:hypothetical protein